VKSAQYEYICTSRCDYQGYVCCINCKERYCSRPCGMSKRVTKPEDCNKSRLLTRVIAEEL